MHLSEANFPSLAAPGVLLAVLQSSTDPSANVCVVVSSSTRNYQRLICRAQSCPLIWKGCDCLGTKQATRPCRRFSFILSFWPHWFIMMTSWFAIQIPFFLWSRLPKECFALPALTLNTSVFSVILENIQEMQSQSIEPLKMINSSNISLR